MAEILDLMDRVNPNGPWYEQLSRYKQLPLWDGDVPGYDTTLGQPKPSVTMFKAPGGAGKGCVIVMAGGGYSFKSTGEGVNICRRLNIDGINAALLDYRIIPYPKSAILADAKRCVRYLRCHAEELEINPGKIGVMGFSAGGNLAASTCFEGDDGNPDSPDPVERFSCRPDAAVLAYAAVVLVEEEEEDDGEFDLFKYFNYKPTGDMRFPPAFIWQSFEDMLISYKSTFSLVELLRKKRVPVELHIFPYGEHGQNLADRIKYEKPEESSFDALTIAWSGLCTRWLKYYGF